MLSLKTISEINCNDLSIRDLDFFTFNEKMGKGKNFYTGKPKEVGEERKKERVYIFKRDLM